jgi:hypothetical protein
MREANDLLLGLGKYKQISVSANWLAYFPRCYGMKNGKFT